MLLFLDMSNILNTIRNTFLKIHTTQCNKYKITVHCIKIYNFDSNLKSSNITSNKISLIFFGHWNLKQELVFLCNGY